MLLFTLVVFSLICRAADPYPAFYPHDHEKHRSVACARCHPVSMAAPSPGKLGGHETCVDCHNFATDALTKYEAVCGVCHRSKPESKQQPNLFAFPHARPASGFSNRSFSHRAHLADPPSAGACWASTRVWGANPNQPLCTNCHSAVSVADSGRQMSTGSGHSFCFECHCDEPRDRTRIPAFDECAKCHIAAKGSRSRWTALVSEFQHSEHGFDTRSRLKTQAVAKPAADALCRECHASAVSAANMAAVRLPGQATCNRCHTERLGLPDPLSDAVAAKLRAAQP